MAQRMKRIETWGYAEFVLTNAVAVEKGEMVCLDTSTAGEVTKGAVSATLRPIGYADSDLTGDGTLKLRIQLFKEIRLHWWDNDTGTAVAATDIGDVCYIEDDRTVTAATTGRSIAGRVWGIDATNGVLVEMLGFSAS